MLSSEPFDDATMYRTEYTNKCPPYCPASKLNTNPRSVSPDGYVFNNEDARGHLHYRHTSISNQGPQVPNSNQNNVDDKIIADIPGLKIVEPLAA